MPGLAQQELLHGDVLLSATVTEVGWVMLGRTLGPWAGVKVAGEADQKTQWCHQGHPVQTVTTNLMKIILVLGLEPSSQELDPGKKKKGSFHDYRCH